MRLHARRLHGGRGLQGELVVLELLGVVRQAAFEDQPPQVAVGADVVEPVVVHAEVRDVRDHVAARALAAELQQRLVAGGVERRAARRRTESRGSTRSSPAAS